ERKRDPSGTVKNQINTNKKPNYPKSRGGPLRQHKHAQYKRNETVHSLPTPARHLNPDRADKLKQPTDQEEHCHDDGYNLGAQHRSRYKHQTYNPKQHRGQQVMEEPDPMPDHNRLGYLNAGSEYEEPTEKNHGDNCGCHGTCHGNDA